MMAEPLKSAPTDVGAPGPVLKLVPAPPAPAPPAKPTGESGGIGLSVGTKYLAVILFALLMAVSTIVFNATHLFQKDNLNNIYVASDLLTTAKAAQVRFWLNSVIQKGNVLGKILISGDSAKSSDETLLKTFESDSDILAVTLFQKSGESGFSEQGKWSNPSLASALHLEDERLEEVQNGISVPFEKVSSGAVQLSSQVLPDGQPLLVVNIPFVQESPGVFSAILSLVVRQDKLVESFAESGAYTLALVDGEGKILAHPEIDRIRNHEQLGNVPVVRKMLESTLDREFQEFKIGETEYLGAYAKVGIAGIGVISQIPRAHAFEAGRTLVRRSVLIAAIVLALAFLIANLLAQTLVSPIRKLDEAASEVAKGNFQFRVQVKTRDEVARLARSFNLMSGEIERKIQNLGRINESSRVISSTLESKKLLEFALDTLLGLLQARKGVAWLLDPAAGTEIVRGWESGRPDASDPRVVAGLTALRPVIHLDAEQRSFLVVPVAEKSAVIGLLILADKEDSRPFSEEDLFTAGTIMTSVDITFQNIALLRETADKARMDKELETAKLVQDTMFPPAEIRLPGLEIQSFYTPASECGGDWWGMLELPDGKVLLALGDATGHGVPAALVTATAKAACSVIHRIAQDVPRIAESPATVLHFLNKAVYESTLGKIQMTFFVGVLDTKSGELSFASASHDTVYWYKMPAEPRPENGAKENVDALVSEPGPRLGQNAVAEYKSASVRLGPDDLIVLYTDGITEGKNPAQEEYGERKFVRSIARHAHAPVAGVREGLLADFRKFTEKEPLHDDITLAVCKFTR